MENKKKDGGPLVWALTHYEKEVGESLIGQSSALKSFLQLCLQQVYTKRPSAQELLDHSLFK